MQRFSSALLSLAAEFTGRFVPYQGVEIAPLAGGVSVAATDRGALTMIGFDPAGYASERTVVLPSGDLAKACKGIKSAQREVTLDGDSAVVTTFYKEHSTSKEFPLTYSSAEFPPLAHVVAAAIKLWGSQPKSSSTAGRYDLDLLTRAIKAVNGEADSIVLSSYCGGPLRLQREDLQIVIFLMPQEAEPIPAVPPWLTDYASPTAEARASISVSL